MTDIVKHLRWLESHGNENPHYWGQAADEIERLRKMVKNAYNDGFIQGMKETTSSRGGIPWSDCKYRAALGEDK